MDLNHRSGSLNTSNSPAHILYYRYVLTLIIAVLITGLATPVQGAIMQVSSPSVSVNSAYSLDSLLKMNHYPPAPDADYIYAHKQADIRFEKTKESIVAQIQYRIRIKMLSNKTKKASIIEIPYYFADNIESVNKIYGITYKTNGKKIHIDREDIRTINLNARYNVKEFTMPQVDKGSVIEYGYTIRRRYIEELPDFYFAHRVPTAYAEVTLHNPRYLRYRAVPLEFKSPPQYKRTHIDTSQVPKIFTVPQPPPLLVETWSSTNIPAVRNLPYLPSPKEYRNRIKFQMSEFGIPRQPLENSWELVAAKIRRKRNPLDVLKGESGLDTLAQRVNREFDSKKQVQDSLFRLVNERMHYNDNTAISSGQDPSGILQGDRANQAAINQTLLRLLRKAGIRQSWPVLISTSENGSIKKKFPSPLQFNGMLVFTSIRDSTYIMDASYSTSIPGLLPKNMNRGQGMLLKNDSYKWIEITAPQSKNDLQFLVEGRLNTQGDLTGVMKGYAEGYPARMIRENVKSGGQSTEILKSSFFGGYNNLSIDTARLHNIEQYHKSLKIIIKFTLAEYAQDYKSGLKYNPMVLGFLPENPFKSKTRDVPVILDAPEYLSFVYRIGLPETAEIPSAMRNKTLDLPGGRLSELYKIAPDSVAYRYNIVMSNKKYPPKVYPQLRSLYQRWVELSQQKWFIRR